MHEQAIQHYFADKEPMLVEAVPPGWFELTAP